MATGLIIGTYTVDVTSANGCVVSAISNVITQPLPLLPVITSTDVNCNGGNDGTASATVSGGTGAYTYSWAAGGATTAAINSLVAGVYTVTVNGLKEK